MSRGYGRIERAIIETLMRYKWITANDLTGEIFSEPVTASQLRSVKRALRRLEADGAVVNKGITAGQQKCWALGRVKSKIAIPGWEKAVWTRAQQTILKLESQRQEHRALMKVLVDRFGEDEVIRLLQAAGL